jgi:hypothetical protein
MAGIYWLSIKQCAERLLRLEKACALGMAVGGTLIRLLMIGVLFFLLARWAKEIYLTITLSFVSCFTFLLMKQIFVFWKPNNLNIDKSA